MVRKAVAAIPHPHVDVKWPVADVPAVDVPVADALVADVVLWVAVPHVDAKLPVDLVVVLLHLATADATAADVA